jgi:hypothetical protein
MRGTLAVWTAVGVCVATMVTPGGEDQVMATGRSGRSEAGRGRVAASVQVGKYLAPVRAGGKIIANVDIVHESDDLESGPSAR